MPALALLLVPLALPAEPTKQQKKQLQQKEIRELEARTGALQKAIETLQNTKSKKQESVDSWRVVSEIAQRELIKAALERNKAREAITTLKD